MSFSDHLKRAFFLRPTLKVARDLLGQRLILLEGNDERLGGLITETEAYVGSEDLGCHARAGKTRRNEAMWGPPGHAYVYFTYGMHWMLNFVTEREGSPAAVLIRGLWPVEGVNKMLQKRAVSQLEDLTNGPAKLCQALGIDGDWNGIDLCHPDSRLFVEKGSAIAEKNVITGPRVGLTSVPEPWKSIPWRFQIDFAAQRDHTIENLGKTTE
jgi:DNA-3-methyladenine glycosylase